MSPIILESTILPTSPRRSRRTKQVSSVGVGVGVGGSMFGDGPVEEDMGAHALFHPTKSTSTMTTADTITLKDMALRLRRAKRSLFLSAVSTDRPSSPSESLRTILSHLSSSSSSEFMRPIDVEEDDRHCLRMTDQQQQQHMIGSSIVPLTGYRHT